MDQENHANAAADSGEKAVSLKRILVPLDFSERGMEALGFARALGRQFGSTLILVHVIEPLVYPADLGYAPVITDEMVMEMEQEARARLDEQAARLSRAGFAVEVCLRAGRPYLEVAEAARERNADLIVLTTHGYTGLRHVLLGSTAERVVRYAPCPVMVIRDRDRSEKSDSKAKDKAADSAETGADEAA